MLKGYVAKDGIFGEGALKYLSFFASRRKRFIRVNVKNFDEGYTGALTIYLEKQWKNKRKCATMTTIIYMQKLQMKGE